MMEDRPRSELDEVLGMVRSTFARWERLRIPYNLVLTGFTLWFHWPIVRAIPAEPLLLLIFTFAAIGANLCFLAGPLAESYLTWVGLRSRWTSVVIFVLGVLISIPLVWIFPALLWGVRGV